MTKTTYAHLKANARERLLGSYGILILAFLLPSLILSLVDVPFSNRINSGIIYGSVSALLIGCIGYFLLILIQNLFLAGISYMHLKTARKEKTEFADLIYAFRNQPNRYIIQSLLQLLILLLPLLPSLICYALIFQRVELSASAELSDLIIAIISQAPALVCAAGTLFLLGSLADLILELGLSLSVYLLLDQPDMTAAESIRESLRLMRKRKLRLFGLYLSFAGWFLLGLITLYIGFLWLNPYLTQTLTQFYLSVVPEKKGETAEA